MYFRGWTGTLGALLLMVSLSAPVTSYGRAQHAVPPPGPSRSSRAAVPIDLTGYWVSVVTENWRFRMVVPAKGDFAGVPLTREGITVADNWDPEADERAGLQCRSYGAPAIMGVPGRLHITWADENTLQLETDAGMQKRVFHFGAAAAPAGSSWQGFSTASWDLPDIGGLGAALWQIHVPNTHPVNGTLKVVTDHLLPGYLRKNGVPYSQNAVLTEYFDVVNERGTSWLVVTSIVKDARYLREPYVASFLFKKQSDAKGWDPTPCSSTW